MYCEYFRSTSLLGVSNNFPIKKNNHSEWQSMFRIGFRSTKGWTNKKPSHAKSHQQHQHSIHLKNNEHIHCNHCCCFWYYYYFFIKWSIVVYDDYYLSKKKIVVYDDYNDINSETTPIIHGRSSLVEKKILYSKERKNKKRVNSNSLDSDWSTKERIMISQIPYLTIYWQMLYGSLTSTHLVILTCQRNKREDENRIL